MKDYGTPLPEATLKKLYTPWLNVLRRHESANIIFLPHSDRYYRVNQFINENRSNIPDIQIHQITVQSLMIDSTYEFINIIEQITGDDSKFHVIFIMDAEWVLANASYIFAAMQLISEKNNANIGFINLFETDILEAEFKDILTSYQILSKNLIYQKLYSRTDILHFLYYKSKKFNYKSASRNLATIADKCGGYIWLATEALRYLSDHNTVSFNHQEIIHRLNLIWANLSNSQKTVLAQTAKNGHPDTDYQNIINTFTYQGLLIKKNNTYKITVPILCEYALKINRNSYNLQVIKDEIKLNGVRITSLFTARERIFLKNLIDSSSSLSRDETAAIFWDSENDYTDWALDQVIKRLRNKLTNLGLNKNCISTIKGKGYEWRSDE